MKIILLGINVIAYVLGFVFDVHRNVVKGKLFNLGTIITKVDKITNTINYD